MTSAYARSALNGQDRGPRCTDAELLGRSGIVLNVNGGSVPQVGASGLIALPASLWAVQTNAQGQNAGPFLTVQPVLPGGWAGTGGTYSYNVTAAGSFSVCASGDQTTVNSNGGNTCP